MVDGTVDSSRLCSPKIQGKLTLLTKWKLTKKLIQSRSDHFSSGGVMELFNILTFISFL